MSADAISFEEALRGLRERFVRGSVERRSSPVRPTSRMSRGWKWRLESKLLQAVLSSVTLPIVVGRVGNETSAFRIVIVSCALLAT